MGALIYRLTYKHKSSLIKPAYFTSLNPTAAVMVTVSLCLSDSSLDIWCQYLACFINKAGYAVQHTIKKVDSGSYLPTCEAWLTQKMSTGLDTSILIPLCANLAKLEGAADVTVELILLLLGSSVGRCTDKTENSKITSQDMIYCMCCLLCRFRVLLAVW